MTVTVPEGVDAAGVTAWFAEHVPAARPPLAFALVPGGRSNLTYVVTDAARRRFVLRRPPLHGVLASAHDMAREHRVIAALAPTPVPVPAALGLCEDAGVTGAPFYVMEHVDGTVPRDEPAVRERFDEDGRAAISRSLVEVLAELHAVDPVAVGLGDFGRHHGYLERQLRRWQRQWEQSRTRDLPAVDEAHRRLAARVPPQRAVAIVHGDYRLDNMIVGPDGAVRAVLDWELATLGDPLADMGLLLVYWQGMPAGDAVGVAPTWLPGFLSGPELAAAYARRTGADLSDLPYYQAFGYWKLAVILEGVYARFSTGAYGRPPEWVPGLPASIASLAETALEQAARAGR